MEVPPPLPQQVPPQVLPYATPLYAQPTTDVWSEGKIIIARQRATFPPRCVKCNVPLESAPRKRTYYWHHPALLLIILFNVLIYAIVALVVRKKGVVYIGVCRKHRTRRLIGILIGWFCGLGGVIVAIAGAANNSGWTALAGIAVFAIGMIGAISARLLYPKRIDDFFLWLRGAGREFVQSLPSVPQPEYPMLPPNVPP